jgi:Ca-activated chloride channel homolog
MCYRSPKPRRNARLLVFGLLIGLSGATLCLSAVSHAQQTDSASQHQRPRRVGVAPPTQTTTPPATTSTTRNTSSAGEEVGEDEVVRVDTQLIPVPVVVRDHTGRPVMNLRADNFTIYEDGKPQRLASFATTDAPFEVALLLDTSGSTRAEVALIRRAANAFIEALRPGDRVAVVSFNTAEEGTQKLATVEVQTYLTDDREALKEAVENIGASNGTPYYDALERVAKEIFREPPKAESRGRRALVALTDGVDSTSDSDFATARARLLQAGVLCYFVQVNTEDYVEDRLLKDCQDDGRLSLSKVQLERYRRIYNPHADAEDYTNFCQMGPFERMQISRSLYQLARQEMSGLARDTGGKTFDAPDLNAARAAFAEVAEEIGKQYSLGYYSSNKTRDGRFRQIRVEVHGLQGAQVNAREGYQAPKG